MYLHIYADTSTRSSHSRARMGFQNQLQEFLISIYCISFINILKNKTCLSY